MSGLFDLTGRVALVTGTSRGLGQYMGRALARAGADLVITSRKKADLEPFQAEVEALGRKAFPVELDVRNYDSIQNAVKEAVAAGVPVVASAIGGIVDYVTPGENGYLFPTGDIPACRAAILSALRHPLLGKGIVPTAVLANVRDYLSPATMCRKFLHVYCEATA